MPRSSGPAAGIARGQEIARLQIGNPLNPLKAIGRRNGGVVIDCSWCRITKPLAHLIRSVAVGTTPQRRDKTGAIRSVVTGRCSIDTPPPHQGGIAPIAVVLRRQINKQPLGPDQMGYHQCGQQKHHGVAQAFSSRVRNHRTNRCSRGMVNRTGSPGNVSRRRTSGSGTPFKAKRSRNQPLPP